MSLKLAGFGAAAPGQRQRTDHTGHRGEKLSLPRVILKIQVGHSKLGGICCGHARLGINGVQLDYPRDIFDRQGIQQNGVDDGEDGGIGADAERQRKNGDETEGGVLGEHADGVTDVLPKSLHGLHLPQSEADRRRRTVPMTFWDASSPYEVDGRPALPFLKTIYRDLD